ncbi:MAG: bleomycin resistance protein [Alphaproteobacteria bacterium]|nr:bleomycin resistance protein [Alphaproteobacteria bacterium]
MNIIGVEQLVYGSEDVAAATKFYEDWGLEATGKSAEGADFALPDRTTIHIRRINDPSLPPASVPGSTVRECVWGVKDAASLRAIGAELSRDREVTEDAEGTLHSTDEYGYRMGFRLARRDFAPNALPETNTVGVPVRTNTRAEGALKHRVRQLRISHVVYWAPGDTARAARFYTDRLGFKVTESAKVLGYFLRGALSHDHHNLFLHRNGDNYGFQHVAFEVRDIDEVMMCGNHMEAEGWKSHLGPGRHVMGSNSYWYFWNPAGGVAECSSDMDFITDDWVTKEHDTPPHGGIGWYARPSDANLRPGHGEWTTLADALGPAPAAEARSAAE